MNALRLLRPLFFGLIASLALLPLANAQGVAPAVSLMVGGAPVSSANPLPVTGGGGATPTPIPCPTASTGIAIAGTTLPNCAFSATGGSGGVPVQAGVPTAAPSPASLIQVSDGVPGSQLYAPVGTFSGLPYIVNWGVSDVPATGVVAVSMLRTIAQGDLLVAFASCCNTVQWSAQSGWTSLYNDGGPSPSLGAAWKIAGSGDVGVTASPYSFSNTDSSVTVIEIANVNTGAPITSFGEGGNSRCAAVPANDLALVSVAGTGLGSWGLPQGSMPTQAVGASGGANVQTAWGIPNVSGVYSGSDVCAPNGAVGVSAVLDIAAGPNPTNLWLPIR